MPALLTLGRQDATLLILFFMLVVFPLLYLFRAFDDNTLTSWRWVFGAGGPAATFLWLVPALLAALVLSRFALPPRLEPALLFLSAIAAVLPLWPLPEAIIDASRYFLQAKHAAGEGLIAFVRGWGGPVFAWTDLPLVPFLYGVLFRLFGEHRIVIQCFTTLLFALAVVQTALIGRRLWDRETGFLAGLLLLAMPYLLTQVPLMLVDVPTLFFVTLSVHAWLAALDRGGPARMAGAAAAIACAVLAKYSAWPMLLLLPLITALSLREGRGGVLRRSLIVLGGAALLASVFLLPRLDVVLGQLALLWSWQWPGLGRWSESTVSTFLFQVHPLVTLGAAAGTVLAVRERDLRFLVPSWSILFLVLFRAERIRYLLPLLPLFSLMAGYGLRRLFRDGAVRRFAGYSAVAASLTLVMTAYGPFLDRTTMSNLRDAGAYLDTLPGERIAVRVLPQQASAGNSEAALPLLDLFTRKRIIYDREPLVRPDERSQVTSPLRFTWEQRLPAFYDIDASGETPLHLVVLSGAAFPDRQAGRSVRTFHADTGTFRYRTAVTVLH